MKALKQAVLHSVQATISTLGIEVDVFELLQPAREPDQGDLALPCFQFASALKKSPHVIAEQLAKDLDEMIDFCEVHALNGYLNFRASPQWLFQSLMEGELLNLPIQSTTSFLIEHTSANPNGPFHVGRARNAILGDTLVRLNRLVGHSVTSEYYVDDMGKQVAVLAWALEHLDEEQVDSILSEREAPSEQWANKPDHARVRYYQAAQVLRQDSKNSEEIEMAIGQMVHASEHGDIGVLEQFELAYQPVLDGMLETLGRLRITFDRFTKESHFVTNGQVDTLVETLNQSSLSGVADNGARFLDLGKLGLEGKTEFFYRRGDGSSLYATRDIAYHQWKSTQGAELINVLGEDHKLQAKQVGLTLQHLGHATPNVVFYSFIKLPEGKMSTRKGNVVFMDDLLEEAAFHAHAVVKELRPEYDDEQLADIAEAVATSAVRFNIIKVSPEKGFTFKWEDALSFEGGSAPFIMYSHTRATSILRNISEAGYDLSSLNSRPNAPDVFQAGLTQLMRTLCVHLDVLQKSVEEHRPHLFALHMLQLATSYNAFYRDCHILDGNTINEAYLRVSEIARAMMRDGMEALGLVALDMM